MINLPSQGNNCGYAVFAELTGKSVKQLRNETAQGIEANSKNFSNAIEAQSWIQSHYPKEANSLLFKGAMDVDVDAVGAREADEERAERNKRIRLGLKVGVVVAIVGVGVAAAAVAVNKSK